MSEIITLGSKEQLIARCLPFLKEVKDMTAGAEAEQWLNTRYGVDTELYKDLARLITLGVKEGWAADTEIAGPKYRRARLVALEGVRGHSRLADRP